MTVVRHKSGTVAINVHFHFEHDIWKKTFFRFLLSPAKLISDYFDKNKQCRSNETFLRITRQFFAHWIFRVNGDVTRNKRKESASSWFTLQIRNSVCIDIDAGNFDASLRQYFHRIPLCQSNRLLILLLKSGKGNKIFNQKLHVQTVNKPKSPRFKNHYLTFASFLTPHFLVSNYLKKWAVCCCGHGILLMTAFVMG